MDASKIYETLDKYQIDHLLYLVRRAQHATDHEVGWNKSAAKHENLFLRIGLIRETHSDSAYFVVTELGQEVAKIASVN